MQRKTRPGLYPLALLVAGLTAMATPVAHAQSEEDAAGADVVAPDATAQAELAQEAEPEQENAAQELRYRYETHWTEQIDGGQVAESLDTAQSWLNDAKVQFGDDAVETYVPTMRLAESQYLVGEVDASIESHEEAVRIAEREFGPVSIALVEPLVRLGQIHQNRGDHEAAIPVLLRAKDLTHRNSGIFNRDQASIVDMLSGSFEAMGDMRQATREQRLLFETAERNYPADDPRLVPALEKWARHNARIDRLSTARTLYYRALDIMDKTYGKNDLRQIELLNTMGKTLGAGGETSNEFYPREGANALRRAVEVYESQEFVDQSDVLRAKGRLGDWYMRNDRPNKGLETYQDAVESAIANGVDPAVIDREFGAPRLLSKPTTTIGMTTSARVRTHSKPSKIVFSYDVDTRGHVRNVQVVEDSVGALSALRLMRKRLTNLRHRPRWVDGRAVPTYGLRYEVIFTPDAAGTNVEADGNQAAELPAQP